MQFLNLLLLFPFIYIKYLLCAEIWGELEVQRLVRNRLCP